MNPHLTTGQVVQKTYLTDTDLSRPIFFLHKSVQCLTMAKLNLRLALNLKSTSFFNKSTYRATICDAKIPVSLNLQLKGNTDNIANSFRWSHHQKSNKLLYLRKICLKQFLTNIFLSPEGFRNFENNVLPKPTFLIKKTFFDDFFLSLQVK